MLPLHPPPHKYKLLRLCNKSTVKTKTRVSVHLSKVRCIWKEILSRIIHDTLKRALKKEKAFRMKVKVRVHCQMNYTLL